jgi:hypothetical protein
MPVNSSSRNRIVFGCSHRPTHLSFVSDSCHGGAELRRIAANRPKMNAFERRRLQDGAVGAIGDSGDIIFVVIGGQSDDLGWLLLILTTLSAHPLSSLRENKEHS